MYHHHGGRLKLFLVSRIKKELSHDHWLKYQLWEQSSAIIT